MSTYVEYQLDDQTTLLVEADEATIGNAPIKAGINSEDKVVEAARRFDEALAGVKQSVSILRREFAALETDEVEVTFGIKVASSGGIFAIVQASGEINYTVKVKWKKSSIEKNSTP